jgi:hypothetical protein
VPAGQAERHEGQAVSTAFVPYTESVAAAEKVPELHGVHTRSLMPPAGAE